MSLSGIYHNNHNRHPTCTTLSPEGKPQNKQTNKPKTHYVLCYVVCFGLVNSQFPYRTRSKQYMRIEALVQTRSKQYMRIEALVQFCNRYIYLLILPHIHWPCARFSKES